MCARPPPSNSRKLISTLISSTEANSQIDSVTMMRPTPTQLIALTQWLCQSPTKSILNTPVSTPSRKQHSSSANLPIFSLNSKIINVCSPTCRLNWNTGWAHPTYSRSTFWKRSTKTSKYRTSSISTPSPQPTKVSDTPTSSFQWAVSAKPTSSRSLSASTGVATIYWKWSLPLIQSQKTLTIALLFFMTCPLTWTRLKS